MASFLKIAKNVLLRTCVSFTLLTLFLFVIGSAIPTFGNAIAVTTVLVLFAFSFLLACANLLLNIKHIAYPLRLFLHYLASLLTFYVLFVVVLMQAKGISTVLTDLLLFTFLYAVVMGAFLLFKHALEGKAQGKKAGYEQIYK